MKRRLICQKEIKWDVKILSHLEESNQDYKEISMSRFRKSGWFVQP
jgi:hypothetical protein